MKSLQMKYNMLHILFWCSWLTVFGYVAIFLQYRGLSNTEIGIVTGGGAILSVFTTPYISGLISKIKGLTMSKAIVYIYALIFASFLSLRLITGPHFLIMILYMIMLCTLPAIVPFLSMICMNYIKSGQYINFGFSRGLGSVSYAVAAVIVGQLVEFLNPTVIIWVNIISGILLVVILRTLPDCPIADADENTSVSAMSIIKNYPVFFMILFAFSFFIAASTSLSTYLINIVHNLGGTTSMYGIAVFFMAASEMPLMTITHRLLKRFSGETLIMASAFFYIIRNFTICLAPNLFILVIGMTFQGFSYGLLTATITYYVNDHLAEPDQMMGQTLIGMMTTGLGCSLGNICGGVLQDALGLNSMLIFACSLTVIGVIIMFVTLRKKVFVKA